jgi:hypothetical protein
MMGKVKVASTTVRISGALTVDGGKTYVYVKNVTVLFTYVIEF